MKTIVPGYKNYCPKLPLDCGVIVRTEAREADAEHLLTEIGQLSQKWLAVLDTDTIRDAIPAHGSAVALSICSRQLADHVTKL